MGALTTDETTTIRAKVQANQKGRTRPRINAVGFKPRTSGAGSGRALDLPAQVVIDGRKHVGTVVVLTGSAPYLHVSSPLQRKSDGMFLTLEEALSDAGLSVGDDLHLEIIVKVKPA
jgi:hypothetical protein